MKYAGSGWSIAGRFFVESQKGTMMFGREPIRATFSKNLTRRDMLRKGTAVGLGGAGFLASRPSLVGLAQASDIDAFYTPKQGSFDGQSITVVINAGQLSNPLAQAAFEKLRVDFEEVSGASVEFVPLPENQMYDQVLLELSTNSGKFDMMHTGAGGAKDYGLSGFLTALPTPPDVDDFFEADLAQYTIGENLYGLPMIGDINILYWRTDLFELAGLDPATPPSTYDEFREFAIRLTTDKTGLHPGDDGFDANNIEVYGSAFKGVAGLASTWEWYNYLYAFGGDLMDADFNPTLDSPESIASLAWVVDNFREYQIYPRDIPVFDYTEFNTLWLQGKMAMAINWPFMYALSQDPEQSQVVGQVAVGVKPSQVTVGGNIGGWSWNVFEMSKKQELAIAFAKWMSSPSAGLAYAEAGSGNPVRRTVSETLAESDPVLAAAIGANKESGQSVAWLSTGPSWLKIERVQYEAIQRALIGDASPEEALQDANEEVTAILEKDGFFDEIVPQLKG